MEKNKTSIMNPILKNMIIILYGWLDSRAVIGQFQVR